MADSSVVITQGVGTNVDTRTAGGEHRQVVVVGNPSVVDSVAEVRAADPGSDVLGMVVREPNTTAIVSGLRDVRVQSIVDGTISIENITRVRNVVDGTISLVTRVDRLFNLVDGTISTVSRVDRVFNLVDGTISTVQRVQNIVDGTISSIPRVDRVFNLIDGTVSTVTGVDRVRNLVDGTISTIFRVDRVINLIDGTLTTLTRADRIFNLVDGTISSIPRVDRVFNLVDGTISTVTRVDRVMNIVDGSIVVRSITNTVAAYFDRGYPAVNIYSTGVLTESGNTAAGSSSAVSASGATIVSPVTGSRVKVYAIAVTTTAQVHLTVQWTNGAGTSPVVFWQTGLQAPSAGIAGYNLAVTPPGYLFATAAGATLALVLNSASLVHYSVAYFKESA